VAGLRAWVLQPNGPSVQFRHTPPSLGCNVVLHLYLDCPDLDRSDQPASGLTYGRGRTLSPLTFKLLRGERDRLERSMDNCIEIWNDPLYKRLPWYDYDSSLAESRLALAEINAEIARWILLPLQKYFVVDHHLDT
jgi:hypothetical protein